MTYLLLYLAITIVGYIIGSRLKKIGKAPTWVGKVMTAVIVILIFIMGTRIGNNEQILQSLDTIGLIAFIFTLIIMFFTCLGFTIARRLFGFDRYGIRHGGGKKLSHGKGKNGSVTGNTKFDIVCIGSILTNDIDNQLRLCASHYRYAFTNHVKSFPYFE